MSNKPAPAIGNSLARGFGMMAAIAVVRKGAGFVGQLIVAKFLFPEHFGEFATVLTAVDLFDVSTKLGMKDILLSRMKRLPAWFGHAMWLNTGAGLAMMLLLMALSVPISWAYDANGHAAMMICVAALAIPIRSMNTVLESTFGAGMRFARLAYIDAVTIPVQWGLTIALAAAGAGTLALVLPLLAVAGMRSIMLLRARSHMRSRRPRPVRWRYLLRNAKYVLTTNYAAVLLRQGDYMLLGLLTDRNTLGFYYFAFNLATQPIIMLSQQLVGVMTPGLAVLRDDPARQRRAFLSASAMMSLVLMPVSGAASATAGWTLELLYGDRWLPSAPMLMILSFSSGMAGVAWNNMSMFAARGAFRTQTYVSVGSSLLFLTFVATGIVTYGAIGACVGVLAHRIVGFPISTGFAAGSKQAGWSAAGHTFGSALVSAACFWFAWYVGSLVPVPPGRAWLVVPILVSLVIGFPLYLACIRVLFRSAFDELVRRTYAAMPGRLRNRIASRAGV